MHQKSDVFTSTKAEVKLKSLRIEVTKAVEKLVPEGSTINFKVSQTFVPNLPDTTVNVTGVTRKESEVFVLITHPNSDKPDVEVELKAFDVSDLITILGILEELPVTMPGFVAPEGMKLRHKFVSNRHLQYVGLRFTVLYKFDEPGRYAIRFEDGREIAAHEDEIYEPISKKQPV